MKVINEKAYYAFKNRLLQFNKNYGDKLSKDELLTEELFNDIGDAWKDIAYDYSEGFDGIKFENIKSDSWITDEQNRKLLNAAEKIYDHLKQLVQSKRLGEPYKNAHDVEDMDYTRVADEIIELGVFAIHAYTNVFDQCLNRYNQGHVTQALDRGTQFAHAFYKPRELSTYGVPYTTDRLLRDPLHALSTMTLPYSKENYQNLKEPPKKTYLEMRAERDAIEKQREELREQERIREQQRQDEEARRIAEQEREAEQKEAIEREENDYRDSKTRAPYVENLENPPEIHQAFYAYFSQFSNRMGIDQKVLNAQTLLTEIGQIQLDCRGKSPDVFSSRMVPLLRQVRRVTFEAYVEKCIKENLPMDLNAATNEVDDLMGALVYSADPHGFNSKAAYNEQLIRARYAKNGFANINENKLNPLDRELVLKHMSQDYLKDKSQFFIAEGEAKFAAFTAERKSSGRILRELRTSINAYQSYLTANSPNAPAGAAPAEHTERSQHIEAGLRKEAFDAAYALEKRVETRYATKASRFFRFISYRRQSKELANMKKVLGLTNETRIADCIAADRARNLFVDASDSKVYLNKAPINDNEQARQMIRGNLEKYAGKLPEIDARDVVSQMAKSANLKEERELNKELEDRGLVIQNAPEKKESLEEEQNRIEENKRIQQEIKNYERERLERQAMKDRTRAANLPLYNKKVEHLRGRIKEEYQKLKDAEKERIQERDALQARHDAVSERLPAMRLQTQKLNLELERLTTQLADYSQKRTNHFHNVVTAEENKKVMEKAATEASKEAKKQIQKQRLGNAKKAAGVVESNEYIAFYDKKIVETGTALQIKQEEVETNQKAINAIVDEMAILKAEITNKSTYGKKEIELHYKVLDYKDQVKYLEENKDEVLESGEGLKDINERVGPPARQYEENPFEVVVDYDEKEAIMIHELINEPIAKKAPPVKLSNKTVQMSKEK